MNRQLEENTSALKEVQATLDDFVTKTSPDRDANGDAAMNRKRPAPVGQSSPIKKKNASVALLVTGFTVTYS